MRVKLKKLKHLILRKRLTKKEHLSLSEEGKLLKNKQTRIKRLQASPKLVENQRARMNQNQSQMRVRVKMNNRMQVKLSKKLKFRNQLKEVENQKLNKHQLRSSLSKDLPELIKRGHHQRRIQYRNRSSQSNQLQQEEVTTTRRKLTRKIRMKTLKIQ